MPRKIEISHKTIVFTVVFLASLWVLYTVRELLLTLFLALLLMTVLNPLVKKLVNLKVPRVLAIFLCYLLVIAVFAVTIWGIVPPLVYQTTNFVASLPKYVVALGLDKLVSDQLTREIASQFVNLPAQILKLVYSVFANVVSILAVLIFSFYFLLARDRLDSQLVAFLGQEKKDQVGEVTDTLEKRLGGWARGELTLMAAVGLANFIGFSVIGIPFVLPLSILAGLLEIVPVLGPVIAAVPAVIIGFTISPLVGLGAAVVAFVVQQLENYLLVPKIMQRSVNVPPLVTLISLSVGFRLLGIVGAIISVPIVITSQVLLKKYFSLK
jgi:predicted PurR-regulated permease PerM